PLARTRLRVRQQGAAWCLTPEGTGRKDVAELVGQHAQEQEENEDEAVPGGFRAAGDVAGAPDPDQEQQERDVNTDRRPGDPANADRPRHGTTSRTGRVCLRYEGCAGSARRCGGVVRTNTQRPLRREGPRRVLGQAIVSATTACPSCAAGARGCAGVAHSGG